MAMYHKRRAIVFPSKVRSAELGGEVERFTNTSPEFKLLGCLRRAARCEPCQWLLPIVCSSCMTSKTASNLLLSISSRRASTSRAGIRWWLPTFVA